MEIQDVLKITEELCKQIDRLCVITNITAEDACDVKISYDLSDPQAVFQFKELAAMLRQLNDASTVYHSFLSDETTTYNSGVLRYDTDIERFCLGTCELHCGDCLEVCVTDMDNVKQWIPTRIEMSSDDKWYLVGVGRRYGITDAKDLVGLRARQRITAV